MPSPAKGESQEDFIERCMGDEEANKTFPDNKQRLAFCHSQWSKERNMIVVDETRACGELEIREVDGQSQIVGYAAVFNSLSDELDGGFREIIVPGAFRNVLATPADIVALVEHAPPPLGRRSAGTLQIMEDDHGLSVAITPPDTQDSRDAVARIRRGDYSGMSFRFRVARGGQTWKRDGGERIREIRQVDKLPEVSVVTFPAYPDTTVAMRSWQLSQRSALDAWCELQRRRLDLAAVSS